MTKKAKPVWTQTKGRRTPRPHGKVEGENGSEPRLEVQPHQPAPEPTVPQPVTPRISERDAGAAGLRESSAPKEPDLSSLPVAMRQAYLSRLVDESYHGL